MHTTTTAQGGGTGLYTAGGGGRRGWSGPEWAGGLLVETGIVRSIKVDEPTRARQAWQAWHAPAHAVGLCQRMVDERVIGSAGGAERCGGRPWGKCGQAKRLISICVLCRCSVGD
jgi:hypothetical protein